MNPRKALETLRRAAPTLDADYDHIFEPAGGALSPAVALLATGAAGLAPGGTRIAMIDGGVASHPSMARAQIEQKGFAGPASATGHGTAVASLLVGDEGAFKGAARGASLFVGDVYGGNPAAGSASAIVRALGWAASKNPRLINISLVGPANRAIERAVAALNGRGIMVVAAVGNDGPAAPPQFPASYAGVVAVTGVDAKGKALTEAGRARHLDFAAPGADLAAALPGRGYSAVRGTSFAAPLAAARLAATGSPDAPRRRGAAGQGQGRARHRLRPVPHRAQGGRREIKISVRRDEARDGGRSPPDATDKENDMKTIIALSIAAAATIAMPAQAQLLGGAPAAASAAPSAAPSAA